MAPFFLIAGFDTDDLNGVTHRFQLDSGYPRFRDVEQYRDVDVLILGSSHSYRSFDPRIFAKHGIETFNLGSTAQTPLNSYYLLKRYYDQLSPRLTIIETYFETLDKDGLEAFYDLSVHAPVSMELLQMAVATRNPHAVNCLLSDLLVLPSNEVRRSERGRGAYVSRGYVETVGEWKGKFDQEHDVIPLETQLYYLEKCVRYVKSRGGGSW